MKWDVGDMTSMVSYSNESFDIVFDKGALDALMSEDSSEEVLSKASEMFREILRVLTKSGYYLCITLAEPFVLRHFLEHFNNSSTSMTLHVITNKKPSPFVPLLAVVQKGGQGRLTMHFDRFGNEIKKGNFVTKEVALEAVAHLQEFKQMRFRLGLFPRLG